MFEARVLGIIQHRDHIQNENKNREIVKPNKNRNHQASFPVLRNGDAAPPFGSEHEDKCEEGDVNVVTKNDSLLR